MPTEGDEAVRPGRRERLEQEGDIAADYLEELLEISDLDGDLDMDVEGDRATVSIVGADLPQLVGDQGEVLEALQELTRLAVYRETGERSRLMLDVSGHRARAAYGAGGAGGRDRRQVKESGEQATLEPMSPFERKVVHDVVAAAGLTLRVRGGRAAALRRGAPRIACPLPRDCPATFHVKPTDSPVRKHPRRHPVRRGCSRVALPVAEQFADLLAREATVRGLIGPREVPRLWERHILNCAVITELMPEGSSVCDIGSGAGLPGIALAIRRPDLRVTLVEPLLRRTTFLDLAVSTMGLTNVSVHRGRAEELHGEAVVRCGDVASGGSDGPARALVDAVGARRRPVPGDEGRLGAEQELDSAAREIRRLGGADPRVVTVGAEWLSPPVTVVQVA